MHRDRPAGTEDVGRVLVKLQNMDDPRGLDEAADCEI